MLAAKLDSLTLSYKFHMVEGEAGSHKLSSDLHIVTVVYTHTHHLKKMSKNEQISMMRGSNKSTRWCPEKAESNSSLKQ